MNTQTQTAYTSKYPEIVTVEMVDEAIKIAEIITGTHTWEGVRPAGGTKGLVCLVQEYLDSEKNLRVCGFLAHETAEGYHLGYK